MGVDIKQAVMEALELRLFPALARWLLEAGVSVQDAMELLRTAAVLEAQKSIPEGIDPDSISLVSVRTGLSRRLVRETLAGHKRQGQGARRGGHRGERVLAGWWHDSAFRDARGRPRILPISNAGDSFEALCRRYSGERQYRTILKDLEQAGAVALLAPGDRVQVLRQSYAAVGWTQAGQAAMAEQLAEHIETCLHNFKHPEGTQHWVCRRVANAQVRPEYANILMRDLRAQIEGHATTFYDALTDPQHTAEPQNALAEGLSVTMYFNRRFPGAEETGPTPGTSFTAGLDGADGTSGGGTSRALRTVRKRSAKRRS